MKRFFNIITSLLKRIFTPVNLSKVIIIFVVGFTSRYLINEYLGINVFTEYLTLISITYYSVFAAFIIFIHELFSFFNINIIPNFVFNTWSKIYQIFEFIFVKPFIWIYSITWGKNPYIFHMNNSRYSSNSVHMGNEQHYYSSERVYDTDSFYNRVAQQNPYQVEYSSVNRIPHPSHYPSSEYYSEHRRGYSDEYVDHNVSPHYNTSYQQAQENTSYLNDDSRLFRIDTIQQDGVERSFHTPINAPAMSYNTTPSTMTPLFNSNQGSQSSIAYTNDTNHATIGSNRSKSYYNLPARRYALTTPMVTDNIMMVREEHILSPSQVRGAVSLGVKYTNDRSYFDTDSSVPDSNIHTLYIKYHDLTKRKFYWNIWEKHHGDYSSYEDFKRNFDPNMNIWKEIAKTIKSDLSKEIHDLLKSDPFGTKRPTVTVRDIRRVNSSNTQDHLNRMNSKRYNATSLPPRKRN